MIPRKLDYVRKKFRPQLDRNLQRALAHQLGRALPQLGPVLRAALARRLLEVVDAHLRPRDHLRHGQVLWAAISRDDPPRRHQRLADTQLRPVVLDLSTPEDIHGRLERLSRGPRLLTRARRLCQQAFEQGGLLGNCDLAELLNCSDSHIAKLLAAFERQSGQSVPRRATLHDVGSGLTHKRLICWQRWRLGKSPEQIARDTHHSLAAVDSYLGQLERVRHCRQLGMEAPRIAFTLQCSQRLVEEYLALAAELDSPEEPDHA